MEAGRGDSKVTVNGSTNIETDLLTDAVGSFKKKKSTVGATAVNTASKWEVGEDKN